MDARTFDTVVKTLSRSLSRRTAVGGSVAAWLMTTTTLVEDALAKSKRNRNDGKTEHRDNRNRIGGAEKDDKDKDKQKGDKEGNGGGGEGKNGNTKNDKDTKDNRDRVGEEACIPTGKQCPSPKPRGKGKGNGKKGKKAKQLSCNQCCQGTFITSGGKKHCACKQEGTGCSASAECCSGRCDGGVCVCEGCAAVGSAGSVGGAPGLTTDICANPPQSNGTSCDDGNLCTTNDVCQNGVCSGTPKDCSSESDACNVGVCDPATDTCQKQPKSNGVACSDNQSCTTGDSCQNGSCTPGTGVDCSRLNDECNTGVCRQSDGECVKQPKDDTTSCNADSDACTEGDTCQGGICVAGPPRSCPVCQACSGGDCQPISSDSRCATVCCNGTCCAAGNQCDGNSCPETCLALTETCSPSNNQCCQSPVTNCAPLAPNCYATGDPQDDRCCRDLRGACSNDCECCGISACEGNQCCHYPGGACDTEDDCCGSDRNKNCLAGKCCVEDACEPTDDPTNDPCCAGFCGPEGFCQSCLHLQQSCESDNQCCQDEPTNCDESAPQSGEAICCRPPGGTCSSHDDCCRGVACSNGRCCLGQSQQCAASSECCPGFECRGGQCRSEICLEPTEQCDPTNNQCCQDGTVDCRTTFESSGTNVCCRPYNQTCRVTKECCDITLCGPEGKCCLGSLFDPDRYEARGCIGRENECCPGRRCNEFSNSCCLEEGQPVPPDNRGGVVDCCHFTQENGVCSCHANGQLCTAPTGNPLLSSCCDGLYCVTADLDTRETRCEPPCNFYPFTPCGRPGDLPCCKSLTCHQGVCQ